MIIFIQNQNMSRKIIVSGAGCCLVDKIYPQIDFSHPDMQKYLSRSAGDGGLHPGRLVFSEQFEAFSDKPLKDIIEEIARGRKEPVLNVGGPSIVALVHASQLLNDSPVEVNYFGTRGDDEPGAFLQTSLDETPVNCERLRIARGSTPSTIVLSDPSYNNDQGERAFINDIGASWNMGPEDLEHGFFDSDVVIFGGTALVPGLHDKLTDLLKKAKEKGCLTVVNTVYDFRSEFARPGEKWPLGQGDESYKHIDLLITDLEEALHLSGRDNLLSAGNYFIEQGVSSFLITAGTDHILAYSGGKLFKSLPLSRFPVSPELIHDLKGYQGGDTTGCGDNFAGGVIAALAWQLVENNDKSDLTECLAWGTVSGGYCCFHLGGTMMEKEVGEKFQAIQPYFEKYMNHFHD